MLRGCLPARLNPARPRMKLLPEMPPPSSQLLAKNYSQRLRSFRPDTHMKHWIIAALICSACAAYASEDDNKIHPTCVDDATRADVGSSRAAHRSEAPQLQPVVPAPQAAIPPPAPAIVCPFHPRRDGGPPPLIFRFGPYGLTVPRRYAGSPSAEHRLTEPRPIAYSWMALAGGARLHLGKYEESAAWLVLSVIGGPRFPLKHERHSLLPALRNLSNSLRPSGPTARPRSLSKSRSGIDLRFGEIERTKRLELPWPGRRRVRSLSSAVRRITATKVAGSEAENVIKYARAARSDVTSSGSSI